MSVDRLTMSDQQWIEKVNSDPQFQQLYALHKQGGRLPDGTAASYALNRYINQIGLPKGRSFTMVNGEPALKDRTSAWTMPIAAAVAAGTLGVAAFAPAALGIGGAGGGGAATGGGTAATAGTTAATGATAAGTTAATAGTSLGSKILGALGGKVGALQTAGQLAGSIAGGRAQGRLAEAQFGLDRAGVQSGLESANNRRMIALDLLAGMEAKPGSRLASLSPETRQTLMSRVGALRQNPTAGLPEMPRAGMGDKLLGILSGVGQFGGALLPSFLKPKPPANPGGGINTGFTPPTPGGFRFD